jgi:predicted MPP superfamily phosphohydrolase
MVIFLGIVLIVVFGIHFYLWWRLFRSTTRPGSRVRRIGVWLIVAADLILISTLILTRLDAKLGWLAAIGYIWLAVMFYLLVTLAVLEIPAAIAKRLAARPARKAAPDAGTIKPGALIGTGDLENTANDDRPQPDVTDEDASDGRTTRRLFIARTAAITAGVVAVGTTGYGVTQALGAPRIKRRQIALAKLPRSMDGYRIALVSDIHLGPLAGVQHTTRIVEALNSMDADIVAVVGDLVDGTVEELGAAAQPLSKLHHKNGAYFVTGNHEYFSGFEPWLAEVADLGMKPLRNQRVELPGGLDLAGVNDVTGEGFDDGPDFAKALGDRDPNKAVVLLAHQPIQVEQAAKFGVDLQLSGHTHGGQMAPFNLIVGLQQPVISGYDVIDGTQIYVTNGAGFWGPPVRVGAPPDVTLIELRTA